MLSMNFSPLVASPMTEQQQQQEHLHKESDGSVCVVTNEVSFIVSSSSIAAVQYLINAKLLVCEEAIYYT